MSVILKSFVRAYYYFNEEIADPRVQEWFLMRTPWPGLGILALYLMTVFKWLPAYMEKRPAFRIRGLIAAYNILQIISCAYVAYQSLVLGWLSHYKLICQPVNEGPNDMEYAWRVCYGYFALKLTDLLDTIFFILRKKQNQVTFLHVYHHCGMVAVAWGMVKWVPGGHVSFMVPINSVVHMIMYTYYLLTVWDESFKKSMWWKKYVTQIQIIQFTILLVHFILLAVSPTNCGFPRQPAFIMIPQNLFMVILFGDFYYRTYIKSKKAVQNGSTKKK